MQNKVGEHTIKLDKLKLELSSLLEKIEKEGELQVGDKIICKKNIDIKGIGIFNNGDYIEILEISTSGSKYCPSTVIVRVSATGYTFALSKGIFVMHFCDNIIIKQKELLEKQKKLEGEILKEERRLEKSTKTGRDLETEYEISQIKKKIDFILGILKKCIRWRKKYK